MFLKSSRKVSLKLRLGRLIMPGISNSTLSPEVWRDMPYDTKSDIWSLGCVLYESIMLKPPFRADDM